MSEVVVGSLRLSRAKSLKREFEISAPYDTGMFEAQTVPLALTHDKWLIARGLKGVITNSYTNSMFGGVDKDVGKPTEMSLQFHDYDIRDMLDPLIAERDYHVTLNERGRELLFQYLPPLPGETAVEYAARRIGRASDEVVVEEVSFGTLAPHPHEFNADRSASDVGFVNGQLHLFSTHWGEPQDKPHVRFCYCFPYDFAMRIVANSETVIGQRGNIHGRQSPDLITLGEVLPVKPRVPDTSYGALSGTLVVDGKTYVRHAELRRPDASLSLLPMVVVDLLDAEGHAVDPYAVFDEKIAAMVNADVRELGHVIQGAVNIRSAVFPPMVSSSQYESVLEGRRAAFEENLPAHAILRVDTKSAAFEDIGRNVELARVLGEVAERVKGGSESFAVADMNGNKVARFELVAAVPDESPSGAAPNGRVRLQVDLAGLPMGRLADNLWPVLKQAQEKALMAEGSFMLSNPDGAFIGAVVINDLPARERNAELGVEP